MSISRVPALSCLLFRFALDYYLHTRIIVTSLRSTTTVIPTSALNSPTHQSVLPSMFLRHSPTFNHHIFYNKLCLLAFASCLIYLSSHQFRKKIILERWSSSLFVWRKHCLLTTTEVTCDKEQLINVQIEYGYSDDVSNYKPGHVLYFECTDEKEMMYGHRVIECQSDGKWNHPYPTCGVSRKCGPPPYVNNAETVEMRKKEYNTGEKVEYKCFTLHTLETHFPFFKYMTCQQGKWRGNVKCLKPCTVTVEMMNERGIEFAYPNKQKMFVPHNDHVTFRCQIFCLRVRCNDGVMTLPECSFTHIFES